MSENNHISHNVITTLVEGCGNVRWDLTLPQPLGDIFFPF